MPVPEDIRKVPRPSNTVVQDSGKDGPKRYSVRERTGIRYVPGGNPQPINGKTIGYIVDHKFVPLNGKTGNLGPTMLSYGAASLVESLSKDLLTDLLKVYPPDVAYSILALASIKVTKPGVSGNRAGSFYNMSFTNIYLPGASLSKNSISALYQRIGADGIKRSSFFEHRVSRVCDEDHILIDGTLKQDTSRINDLSAFSYKARLKGCEDISILYAYDLEKMEPICAQVFPGNSIDAVSYRSFVRDNKLRRGIIISDKGFPPNEIRDILAINPLLHYITPIKRNDARIAKFQLTNFDDILTGIDGIVQYKKANTAPGVYLYAFRDVKRAAAEEKSYLENARKKGTYDDAKFHEKKKTFGLIVFESDRNLEPKVAYLSYDERWKLELVFKAYKSDDCLDHTSVQGDFSVIGSEFVNFISSVITCRIITKATKAGLFNEMTYRDLIDDLNSAWRETSAPRDTLPVTGDRYWVHTIPKVSEILEKLELCLPAEKPEPKKRGRKPRQTNKTESSDNIIPNTSTQEKTSAEGQAINEKQSQESTESGLGNKAGNETTQAPNEEKCPVGVLENGPIPDSINTKRPVGRPRTRPIPDPNIPKRPVGRPRTRPVPDPNIPKRPVGRPRTRPVPDPNMPKRPVGRPRVRPLPVLNVSE